MNLEEKVYSYPTKYDVGFLPEEVEEIKNDFPNLNEERFNDALAGITVQIRGQKVVIYHCDIVTALRCGIENRGLRPYEFD